MDSPSPPGRELAIPTVQAAASARIPASPHLYRGLFTLLPAHRPTLPPLQLALSLVSKNDGQETVALLVVDLMLSA